MRDRSRERENETQEREEREGGRLEGERERQRVYMCVRESRRRTNSEGQQPPSKNSVCCRIEK